VRSYFLAFVCLVFIHYSCFGQVTEEGLFNIPAPKKKDFDISLALEKVGDSKYLLVADLKLAKDAFIISHYSKDSFYLNFTVQYPDQEAMIATNEINEFPVAMEEFDPIIEQQVKFIRSDTRFSQKFKLKSKDDISINGVIEFLVEPSCIPYDVMFSIIQKDGKVYLGDYQVKISKEYKM